MSDAGWSDVGAACQSAVLHFRNSRRAARHIADEMEAEIKRFREIVDPDRG